VHREIVDARHIDVDLAIAVDVGHGDAGFPPVGISDAGLPGDVLELIIPFVPIKLVRPDVRGEIQVRKPIAVDIANCDAATIVVVKVVDDVEARLGQRVGECDASGFGSEKLKKRPGVRSRLAARKRENNNPGCLRY
jgi:hypothetical protein